MKILRNSLRSARLAGFCAAALVVLLAPRASAQPATGSLEGRISNPATGEYTELARVTVDGTALEAFTDSTGTYRLARVPAGAVRVRAFYTGAEFEPQAVTVASGAVARVDFAWKTGAAAPGVVKLDQFVVASSKEMSGAAVAINTQRFAPNTMTVLSTDEYGEVSAYNIGNVLANVPGITVVPGGLGDPYRVSMNGAPPGNVPVTVNGMTLAHAVDGAGRRDGAMSGLSVNNMSRVEVVFTPTPETQGAALAGAINMVPRSAFDRAKPTYTFDAGIVMRERDRRLGQSPGMGGTDNEAHKINPQGSFAAVVPLSDHFGFTFTGSSTTTRPTRVQVTRNWRGLLTDTNGTTYADTTPDKPYLWNYSYLDSVDELTRRALGGSFDFKLTPRDRFSFSAHYGEFNIGGDGNQITYQLLRVNPGDFGDNFTQGAQGQGQVAIFRRYFYRRDTTWLNTLNYWHDGPVWKIDAGLGYSLSSSAATYQTGLDFEDSRATLNNVTLRFNGTQGFFPRVTIADATGRPVDAGRLANYRLTTSFRPGALNNGASRRVFASVQRDFDWRLPLRIKTGFSLDDTLRDHENTSGQRTFVGADGVANTADDSAGAFVDPGMSARPTSFGFPATEWIHKVRMTEYFRANPAHFTRNEVADYNTVANNSKYARELISAVYLRGDTSFFNNRLKVVGGLRAEQTNIKGQGNSIDATANFQRNSAGNLALGANGQPLLIQPAGSLAATQLTNKARSFEAEKEYLRWFPSLNGTYNIAENFIVRGGYFQSVGRPVFLQYAGSLTLPNLDNPPGPGNRIGVSNVGIKAWQAESYKLSLEYYFKDVGLLQVSGYSREIKNFFGNTVFVPSPEFLANYSLDPVEYEGYQVSTQYNLPGSVRMTGFSVDYKQTLTFLPVWARGLQVFGNFSAQRATGDGDNASNFSGFIPRSANWGVTLARPKFTLRARWNYESRSRGAQYLAGRSVGPAVFDWRASRLLLTLGGEYRLNKRYSLFFDVNNTNDEPIINEVEGPRTPSWAVLRSHISNVRLYTFGLKGSF